MIKYVIAINIICTIYIMDLKTFLKTHSVINNSFIDDFYKLFENNTDDFAIDLELAAKWLNTKKGKLKETLTKSYVKNIDYIIEKVKVTTKGGGGKEKYFFNNRMF